MGRVVKPKPLLTTTMKTFRFFSLLVLSAPLAFGPGALAQRGWTPATRGTVVGAGVGGAAGALIHKKNPVVGALVGGSLGAVAGKQVGKRPVRRWSPQAKGTVIGAGTGAAAGAILHKRNRALGGVVGGVLGGAGGYAVGKTIDNRNKRRAAEAAARAQAERLAAAKAADNPVPGTAPAMGAEVPAAIPALVAYRPQPATGLTAPAFGYLLNPSFGDYSTPYPTSEYRRKSW